MNTKKKPVIPFFICQFVLFSFTFVYHFLSLAFQGKYWKLAMCHGEKERDREREQNQDKPV